MKNPLKYENREELYGFLINDFGLIKIDEKYDASNFGNFYITLVADDFWISYVNDRSFLDVNITIKMEANHSYTLSFVRDFIYNPEKINEEDKKRNAKRIKDLNEFFKNDFDKISELFNPINYMDIKRKIDKLLKDKFRKRFPGMID